MARQWNRRGPSVGNGWRQHHGARADQPAHCVGWSSRRRNLPAITFARRASRRLRIGSSRDLMQDCLSRPINSAHKPAGVGFAHVNGLAAMVDGLGGRRRALERRPLRFARAICGCAAVSPIVLASPSRRHDHPDLGVTYEILFFGGGKSPITSISRGVLHVRQGRHLRGPEG